MLLLEYVLFSTVLSVFRVMLFLMQSLQYNSMIAQTDESMVSFRSYQCRRVPSRWKIRIISKIIRSASPTPITTCRPVTRVVLVSLLGEVDGPSVGVICGVVEMAGDGVTVLGEKSSEQLIEDGSVVFTWKSVYEQTVCVGGWGSGPLELGKRPSVHSITI